MDEAIRASVLIFVIFAGRSLVQSWLKDYAEGRKLDRFKHF